VRSEDWFVALLHAIGLVLAAFVVSLKIEFFEVPYWTVLTCLAVVSAFCIHNTRRIARGKIASAGQSTSWMEGKTAIVTGANCGIGIEVAMQLARWGCSVILACRELERATAAQSLVCKAAALDPNSRRVTAMQVDLSDLNSCRQFSESVVEAKIDVHFLINNAGVAYVDPASPSVNPQGINTHFCTNHLGHFFITKSLDDVLKRNNARVINVSSVMHAFVRPRKEKGLFSKDLLTAATGRNGKPKNLYSLTKLANLMHARQLQKHFSTSSDALAFSVHPGFVKSEIWKGTFVDSLLPVLFMAKDSKAGAQTILHLCCAPVSELIPGGYYVNCKPFPPSPVALNDEVNEELWRISEELINFKATIST